jgi:hypothetical protein
VASCSSLRTGAVAVGEPTSTRSREPVRDPDAHGAELAQQLRGPRLRRPVVARAQRRRQPLVAADPAGPAWPPARGPGCRG